MSFDMQELEMLRTAAADAKESVPRLEVGFDFRTCGPDRIVLVLTDNMWSSVHIIHYYLADKMQPSRTFAVRAQAFKTALTNTLKRIQSADKECAKWHKECAKKLVADEQKQDKAN
jgi:hypothetical protein